MRQPPKQTQKLTQAVELEDGRFRLSFQRDSGRHVSLVISRKDANRLQEHISRALGHFED